MDSNLFSKKISERLGLPQKSVKATIELLTEGATVPFISRYRKERTNSLDEVAISEISNELEKLKELIKRKETILKSISEQNQLSSDLRKSIEECWDAKSLEDIYLPFKRKIKTKATIARERGLEPLAKIIMAQKADRLASIAKKYTNKNVGSVEEALEGARYIIAEWINEHPLNRKKLRQQLARHSDLVSKLVKGKEKEGEKYKDYFAFSELARKAPSHRVLAMFRGEKEGLLRIKLDIETDPFIKDILSKIVRNPSSESAHHIELAVKDSMKRLMLPSLRLEYRNELKEKADKEAIHVFQKNLENLLLEAPLGSKTVLAIDPGFKTGCKCVILDANGKPLTDGTIFPNPPQNQSEEAIAKVSKWVQKYKVKAIAIGNGTAGLETFRLVKNMNFGESVEVFLVNESGASVYSASVISREEFPDKDVTVRGSISIGRRLMDPLAELIKIDAKSIGVGQYQHDVNQKLLKESLDTTLLSCVNSVGINLNTASKYILKYISGLGEVVASNIIKYRDANGPFKNRNELKKVPRLGPKAFEQSAGFLRIQNGTNVLDNTGVHPERYKLIEYIAKDQKFKIEDLIRNHKSIEGIPFDKYVNDEVGLPTLKDIKNELLKPGLDPRGKAKEPSFSLNIKSISDVREGMLLSGVIKNVAKFGAFVDMGIKESGLIHISQMADHFISDPSEVVSVNQEVKIEVIEVDQERKRISLKLIKK